MGRPKKHTRTSSRDSKNSHSKLRTAKSHTDDPEWRPKGKWSFTTPKSVDGWPPCNHCSYPVFSPSLWVGEEGRVWHHGCVRAILLRFVRRFEERSTQEVAEFCARARRMFAIGESESLPWPDINI